MTNQQILYKYYSPSTTEIIGEMYGGRKSAQQQTFISINKKSLILTKDGDAFYYIWGWPGPDSNRYDFKDYGDTWAFTREELNNV